MHILSIITSFTTGGAETLVTNLSEGFVKAGHRSTVVALCDAEHFGNCVDMERDFRARVTAAGGEPDTLGLSGRRSIFAGALALRRMLAQTQPDIIHAHTARVLPMLWLARPGVPVILTHHNTRFSFSPRLFRLFDRIVHGYIAISRECAALMAPHIRKPMSIIANAAGRGFKMTNPRTGPAMDATILSVGALSDQKDYPTLVRAAAPLRRRLAERGRRAHIRIAGGGESMPALQALVAEEGVGDMVELLGPRGDIPALLAEADLFVNCSLYEGLPIAIIEAMSAALPVVATDVGGNRELIHDGYNGLLIAAQDPEALAAAIDTALADAETYFNMSRAALAESGKYTIDRCVREHIQIYSNACHAPAARGLPARA